MHIKNVNSKTTLKRVIEYTIYIFIILTALILLYLGSDSTPTIAGAINAAKSNLTALMLEGSKHGAWGIIIFLLLPIWLFISCIFIIIKRNQELKILKQPFNLESIKFLDNHICFNFYNKQFNFVCGYNDIQNLHIDIVTGITKTNPRIIYIEEIQLKFTALNGKIFTITTTGGFSPLQYLYKILNYTKKIPNFSYSYAGYGKNKNLDEKINIYQMTGRRIFFSKDISQIVITVLIILILPFLFIDYNKHDKDIINYVANIKSHLSEGKSICGNLTANYNGLSKEEIYKLRKRQVARSIFNPPNYRPKEEVFGRIQTGKPWWGLKQRICAEFTNPNFDRTSGPSALSKYIQNPNVLIGVDYPFCIRKESDEIGYCNSWTSKLLPSGFTYYKDKNLIVAKYKIMPEVLKSRINLGRKPKPYFMTLNGLNARDLGYNYVYAISKRNIRMTGYNNIAKEIYTFKDFIHVGTSCGVQGGCNNISPHQNELDFAITALPAQITLKLWKKKPFIYTQKADMYYTIMFESAGG